jgi:hypothetical protein
VVLYGNVTEKLAIKVRDNNGSAFHYSLFKEHQLSYYGLATPTYMIRTDTAERSENAAPTPLSAIPVLDQA